ncbi:MAG: NTP transferase domain-containing protein, partial [Actinomycetota bacterium]
QTVGGVPRGAGAGRALLQAASRVSALGRDPGLGLPTIEDSRAGPLAALAAGMRHLAQTGHTGPVLLVACDLPFLTSQLLNLVARELRAGAQAAVPVAGGRLQPLAACYAPEVLPVAEALVAARQLSMRSLLAEIDVNRVEPETWGSVAGPDALVDVDTLDDLQAANRALLR